MIQLSNRLQMVADMVNRGNRVGDIGCDHAHISIYLAEQGISNRIIAADINKGPLKQANENILLHRCEDVIETRLSDGLKELKPGEVDTIVISGMGGGLMRKILQESHDVMVSAKELVLQPQSEIREVRRFLHQNGFCIAEENMLKEEGKYYIVIRSIKGQEQYEEEIFYRYGKCLLENKNSFLHEFLQYGEDNLKKIISEIEKYGNVPQEYNKSKKRLIEVKEDLTFIEKALLLYYTPSPK